MNTSKIYWASAGFSETLDWNILYSDPENLFKSTLQKKDTNLDKTNNLFLCPSVKNLFEKIIVVKCPLTSHYKIDNNKVTPISNNYLSWDIPHKPNLKNSFLFTINIPYVFFSEEDIEMTMTSPFFSNSQHLKYASIVPGTFNISQWFRSVNFEFNVWQGNEFKIEENEDMVYFNFNTKKKIELVRFDLNTELRKILNTCAESSSWEKFVPLFKRYKRFKQSRLNKKVINLIKNNLL
jgi:hypothetical protein